MNELYFVSGNIHKFLEIQSILKDKATDINLKFFKQNIIEIQEETIQKIAIEKSQSAYNIIKKPIIIEDDGLFIKSLNGFPGQYSSYVLRTIGNEGIIKLLKGQKERKAFFKAIIVYNNGSVNKILTGQSDGVISTKIASGGWGYDPIFIPHKTNVTFATLTDIKKKNQFSHRRMALDKLVKWLKKTGLIHKKYDKHR